MYITHRDIQCYGSALASSDEAHWIDLSKSLLNTDLQTRVTPVKERVEERQEAGSTQMF